MAGLDVGLKDGVVLEIFVNKKLECRRKSKLVAIK